MTNKQNQLQALTCALKTLMEVHPSQRDGISNFVTRLESHAINDVELVTETRKLTQSLLHARDQDLLNYRMAAQEVMKQLHAFQLSEHVSASQRDAMEKLDIGDGASPVDVIKDMFTLCKSFADDAIHFREQSKIIVGDEHKKLKRSDSNIIAGDVARSSKQILNSINPLMFRLAQEYPDNTDIIKVNASIKALNQRAVVDFFDAIGVMEEAMQALTRLQGRRNNAESEYLKTFHLHLKSMHETLSSTISQNSIFERASEKERDALLNLMQGFKDASDSEDDPVRLKKLIADNVNHMRDGFVKVMERQDAHLKQQQRTMSNLRAEVRQHEVSHKKLCEEKERLNTALEEMANLSVVDQLTKVANRRAYDQATHTIDMSMDDCDEPHKMGIVVMDIDHFKKINDTYSHQVGDQVLRKFADLMKQIIKTKNLEEKIELYRYGGEEFVFVYHNMGLRDIVTFSQICRSSLAKRNYKHKDTQLRVTVSMGISCYKKEQNSKTVFELADQALYEAKKRGRNQVVVNKNGSMIGLPHSTNKKAS